MDYITALRSVFTVIVFATFIAIWLWAYSSVRRRAFERAAHAPLEDDDHAADPVLLERSGK